MRSIFSGIIYSDTHLDLHFALATLLLFSDEPHSAKNSPVMTDEPFTLLRFYSDEPGELYGEMDTLQTCLKLELL